MCICPSQWKHESNGGFLFVCSPDSLTAFYYVLNLVAEFCVFLYRNKDVSTLNWCRKCTTWCIKKSECRKWRIWRSKFPVGESELNICQRVKPPLLIGCSWSDQCQVSTLRTRQKDGAWPVYEGCSQQVCAKFKKKKRDHFEVYGLPGIL